MATSSADRFLLTPGVTSDPQPDDTARKGLRRLASTAPAHRACQRGWVTVQSSLYTPGGRAYASSRPGRRKARFSAQQG